MLYLCVLPPFLPPSLPLGVLLPTPSPSYNAVPPPGAPSTEATPPTRPSAPPTSPSSAKPDTGDPSPAPRGKFPPGFSTYVNRAFAACTTSDQRERVHKYLDVELNKLFTENKQWEINWDTYPLPRYATSASILMYMYTKVRDMVIHKI